MRRQGIQKRLLRRVFCFEWCICNNKFHKVFCHHKIHSCSSVQRRNFWWISTLDISGISDLATGNIDRAIRSCCSVLGRVCTTGSRGGESSWHGDFTKVVFEILLRWWRRLWTCSLPHPQCSCTDQLPDCWLVAGSMVKNSSKKFLTTIKL